MASVYEFPDRSTEEEAARWLIRLDSDDPLSPAEIEELREWLQRSPTHREELSSLVRLYGKMNILTELAVPLGTHTLSESIGRPRRYVRWSATAAATLVVVVATALLALAWNRDPLLSTNGTYATTVGHQRTVSLADGSEVQLNTHTSIEVDYNAGFRNVRLEYGEAYFSVAKHVDRPFRVYAGGGRIEAIGTAFAVHLQGDDVDVTVAEGTVALAVVNPSAESPTEGDPSLRSGSSSSADAETIGTLSAGQSSVIKDSKRKRGASRDAAPAVRDMASQELARRLAWRDGLLIFAGEPLGQVVHEISRYTTMSIEIDDPTVRNISIGGQFHIGDTDALLDALESSFKLRVTRLDPDHVLLSSASPPPAPEPK